MFVIGCRQIGSLTIEGGREQLSNQCATSTFSIVSTETFCTLACWWLCANTHTHTPIHTEQKKGRGSWSPIRPLELDLSFRRTMPWPWVNRNNLLYPTPPSVSFSVFLVVRFMFSGADMRKSKEKRGEKRRDKGYCLHWFSVLINKQAFPFLLSLGTTNINLGSHNANSKCSLHFINNALVIKYKVT